MNTRVDVLIIGGGSSVSHNFCFCLASKKLKKNIRVAILSRNRKQTEAVVSLYNAIAIAQESSVSFVGSDFSWDNEGELKKKIIDYNPKLVFQCASLQSPWEFLDAKSDTKWKSFIEGAGNGFLVPLLTTLVKKTATIIKENLSDTILVNACFPDNVNPILKHLDLPITCGIGNVAMYTSILRSMVSSDSSIKVLGHLYHYFKILGKQHTSIEGPRVWINEKEIYNVEENLKNSFYHLRNINSFGIFINQLVGSTSVDTILALLDNDITYTHVPGPNGLPGGYPVKIKDRQVTIDLPNGCSEMDAYTLNSQGAYDMGCAIINKEGFIAFSDSSIQFVKQHAHDFLYTEGFHIDELAKACNAMLILKETINSV